MHPPAQRVSPQGTMAAAIAAAAICCAAIAIAAGTEVAATQDPSSGRAPASAEDSAPTLELEPGTHTAPIRRISVNAAGTTLVSTSDDKTARIWDLGSARLLATLHAPAGPGAIGRLYGVSISSSNRIAIAGNTGPLGGKHRILIFDLASRAFVKSIDARDGNVRSLKWSPDGRLLAAAYVDAPAVRVFDAEGTTIFEDKLAGDAYYVAFASNDRLAVSASDGKIHLYSIAGNRVAAERTLAASLPDPRGIHFSPDGRLIAVGYLSRDSRLSVRVDVFEVESGKLSRSFLFQDVDRGNLMNVVWNRDGSALYAGGTGYRDKNRFIVKRMAWPGGNVADIPAAENSILDFAALPDGRIAFATAEPSLGVIEEARAQTLVPSRIARFYEASLLRINADASEVSWRYAPDEEPVHFSLASGQLSDGLGQATRVAQASSTRLRMSDWENNFHPTLNGRALNLGASEVSRASAILPGDAGAVVAASRSLRRYDPDGSERWKVDLPTEARAVNASADGRIVVVAMLDGRICWHRAADGVRLMSLFPTRDRRWLLWTDAGQFRVGPNAEELAGWRVNRVDHEQADFYPLSRFRDLYFRPDVLDRILAAGDAAVALSSANREKLERAQAASDSVRQRVEALVAPPPVEAVLPPSVSLQTAAVIETDAGDVTVRFAVLSSGKGGTPRISARVDGRPFDAASVRLPEKFDGVSAGALTVQLPPRDATVQIFASNDIGTSTPATFSYRFRPAATQPKRAAPVQTEDKRPRLVLLSIGVSRYANDRYNLGYAAKDATDFANTLRRQSGVFYRQVDVKLVVNEEATRAAVLDGLRWLSAATGPDDVGMLYLAGHGVNDVDDVYYFLPHDADGDHVATSGVGEEEFRSVLTAMKGKSIFFVDSCYAGGVIGKFPNPDLTRISNRFASPEFGIIVFSASHGRQESRESPEWGNGAFTKALVEGLRGRADFRREGYVTHKGLDYFVSGEVVRLTAGLQTPVTTVPVGIGDFGLAKVLQ